LEAGRELLRIGRSGFKEYIAGWHN